MKLKDIPIGSSIFIDTNIFFYHITKNRRFGAVCKALIDRIESGQVLGFTSVIVLNELLHTLILVELAKKHHIPEEQAPRYAKRNPSALKGLGAYAIHAKVEAMPNLKVLEVLPYDMSQARDFVDRYHLLSNDALHVAVMQREGLNQLASKDSDFKRVPWIKLYQP